VIRYKLATRIPSPDGKCGNLFTSSPGGNILRFLDRLQPLALLALRFVIGAIMIAHGYGKVFGGFSHVHDMVQHLGFPGWTAYLLAGTEFFGGGHVDRYVCRHLEDSLAQWSQRAGRI